MSKCCEEIWCYQLQTGEEGSTQGVAWGECGLHGEVSVSMGFLCARIAELPDEHNPFPMKVSVSPRY